MEVLNANVQIADEYRRQNYNQQLQMRQIVEYLVMHLGTIVHQVDLV